MTSQVKPKPRPYRDFLTPALHRQFTHAAALSLALCYVEACLMSSSPLLWRWQPLGMTGIRSLLLFISSLLIFLLRVANQHVGTTTSTYPLQTALWRAFSYGPIGTASCYFFSAWFFSEIYLSSLPSKANLGYIDEGGVSGRSQLNERAVYFRTQFLWLPCVQTLFHLVGDYNKLGLPFRKPLSTDGAIDPKVRVLQNLRRIIAASSIKLIVSLGVGTLLYFAAFRHTAWNCFFALTKYMFFWTRNSGPKGAVPSAVLDLLSKSLFAEFAILLLWDWTNAVFSEYIAEPPLKKGKPLTDDSKDPNGSLLGGLRAKRQTAKTMAFWELAYISQSFEIRRKAVYQELDRDGGSTWAQLLTLSLNEVKAIQTRIKVFQDGPAPPLGPKPAPPVEDYQPVAKQPKHNSKVFTPVKQDPSFRGMAKSRINNFVKSQGSHPGASNPAKQIMDKGATEIRDRANLQPGVIKIRAGGYATVILRSRAGVPFRQTFQRRVTAVVCGTPYSRLSIISDAITAISKLAARSISEDQPGQVQKDIPALARTLAGALRDIEAFLASTEPHWTDVEFQEAHRRSAVEVESVIESLRNGLEEILRAFGEYFGAMGVPEAEVGRWRAVVGTDQGEPTTPEMAQAAG